MGGSGLEVGWEGASGVAFEGKDQERPMRVYQIKVYLAPEFEFEGVVTFFKGLWGAVVMVDGREVVRREDIHSFQRAKARVDREYHEVYHKFLGWLNLKLIEI